MNNSEFKTSLLGDRSIVPEFTKKQFFTSQELPLLFQGLIKNLFIRPYKGHLLFESANGGGNLYFEKTYYTELRESVEENYRSGNFAKSNAEADWMNLRFKITHASDIENPNTDNFNLYPVNK